MGVEEATKKGQVQQFFYKKLQRRPGPPPGRMGQRLSASGARPEG